MPKQPPQLIKEYLIEADQWFTHGWRYDNGEVYAYTDDRKEQNSQEGHHYEIEEFLGDPDIDIEIKRWLKDILGGVFE